MDPIQPLLAALTAASQTGDLDEARRLAAQLCMRWPQRAEGWLWQAWLCEEPHRALACARRAAALAPGPDADETLAWAQARVAEAGALPPPEPDDDPAALVAPPRSPRLRRSRLAAALCAALLLIAAASPRLADALPRPAPGAAQAAAPVATPIATAIPTNAAPTRTARASVAATPPPAPPTPTMAPPVLEAAPVVARTDMPPALLEAWERTLPERTWAEEEARPVASAQTIGAGGALLEPGAPQTGNLTNPNEAPLPATPAPPQEGDQRYALWPARNTAVTYQVQPGDNPANLAERFGLQLPTLVWANPALEKNPELLNVGQELIVPPLDGVLHVATRSDTVQSIAAAYGADAAIVAWFPGNGLVGVTAALMDGQQIMVPGGRKPQAAAPPAPTPPPQRASNGNSNTRGYFSWPTGGTITQTAGPYHMAIDIAAPMNTPIYAAQRGEVIFSGWDTSGYGYTILINHHNGWYTRYAHLSGMYPNVGEWVERGELIALMGSTGRSTGPHLHFEIITRGYRYNPLNYLSR